jgi:hypothetical protein
MGHERQFVLGAWGTALLGDVHRYRMLGQKKDLGDLAAAFAGFFPVVSSYEEGFFEHLERAFSVRGALRGVYGLVEKDASFAGAPVNGFMQASDKYNRLVSQAERLGREYSQGLQRAFTDVMAQYGLSYGDDCGPAVLQELHWSALSSKKYALFSDVSWGLFEQTMRWSYAGVPLAVDASRVKDFLGSFEKGLFAGPEAEAWAALERYHGDEGFKDAVFAGLYDRLV